MKTLRSVTLWAVLLACPVAVNAACRAGIYDGDTDFVVLATPVEATPQRYLFPDGRRGFTGDGIVDCDGSVVMVSPAGRARKAWQRRATLEQDATFTSAATALQGRLIEPPGPPDPRRPLVVLVHGSEKASAIGSVYPHLFAAQGVTAFVYDKRGTGASEGDYTQNFELLADDAVAALAKAKAMAAGRVGRAGYFGGSQGGWVAPLAATRSAADFVAVGFGLVSSPVEEDLDQMLDEARDLKVDDRALAQIRRLSAATAGLVRSHFVSGYEPLAEVKREIGGAAWARTIKGEYSGDMLRMTEADLRRVGRARFDNLEILWDYDGKAVLEKLRAPLLWVLAGEDREAPIETTRRALLQIKPARPFDIYLFPQTDHGMVEFTTSADGTRTATRITDGYLRLVSDWIKGDVHGQYGRAERLK